MHTLEAEEKTLFPENRVISNKSVHHSYEKTPGTQSPLTLAAQKNAEQLMGFTKQRGEENLAGMDRRNKRSREKSPH